jgi:hypothetical protein
MSLQTKCFCNIYIIDNMDFWESLRLEKYSLSTDLVLTYDLELYKYIESIGGCVEYIDHLVDTDTMESNNYRIYDYFAKWHLDENGKDLISHKDVDFGFSFRLDFWNDYTTFARLFLSVLYISHLNYDKLFSCKNDKVIKILKTINIDFQLLDTHGTIRNGLYFPIDKWMDEAIRPSGFRRVLFKAREIVVRYFGHIKLAQDKLFPSNKKIVFYQAYNPTYSLIDTALSKGKYRVLLENFSKHGLFVNKFKQRTIPVTSSLDGLQDVSEKIMLKVKKGAQHKLKVLFNNKEFDITDSINEIIFERVSQAMVNKLRLLESATSYLNVNHIDLLVLIANIGGLSTIFDLACKSKGIPSYMIINGLLLNNYMDDAKFATYINSYSTSIRDNYFRGMDNVMALGDPRMDNYPAHQVKEVNRDTPTIVIGASGFNSVDLNSYVAVEFDFMYDVLNALISFNKENEINVIIKVRPNGYAEQYTKMVNQYFSRLGVSIVANKPMKDVLSQADLYLSIYSQTLFEASCLGVPVIYYKKDSEVTNAPFDGKSELVTASNPQDLIQALNDFKIEHVRFDKFLDRKVMEKYVGPMDGKNRERNLDFIDALLSKGG